MRDFASQLPDLNGKSILITGGTGSFGKAFVQGVLDAKVLGLDLKQDVVGIRPGERTDKVPMAGQGTPVGEGFSYASDSNDEWLTPDDLRTLLAQVPEAP